MPPTVPAPYQPHRPHRLRAALLLALIAGTTATPAAWARAPVADALPPPVAEALARAQLPPEALAAAVLPVSPSRLVSPRWLHQADRPMAPASTMKLLTSIVALDTLGPNLRGHTELWTRAPVLPGTTPGSATAAATGAATGAAPGATAAATPADGGVLQGDLILRGGADPELGWPQLTALLAELRWQGIQRIDGDIVLDRQLFRPTRTDLGLPPFDEWPEFPYNGVPDALQLANNLMGLEIRADRERISARPLPPLPAVTIDTSALRLTERACRDWSDDWISPPQVTTEPDGGLRVLLQGGFPRDCVQRPQLALIERNQLAERLLRAAWQGLGGEWRGRVREATEPLLPAPRPLPHPLAQLLPPNPAAVPAATDPTATQAAPHAVAQATTQATTQAAPPGTPDAAQAANAPRLLARRESRPWGELLRPLNKQSDNILTRLLYLQLGANAMATEPATPTAALADRAVRQWLAARRIPTAGLVIDNGSGLSRIERIMPRTLALALQAAYHTRWAPDLIMSLPMVGVDGTMRNRLRASPAGGWARMKTGTLRDTTALAGYVRDDRGRWWVMAAMVNHERAAAGRPALDALVDWIARGGLSPRGLPADPTLVN